MKNVLSFLLICLLGFACQNGGDSPTVKRVVISDKVERISASEIVEDITYIPLQTDSVYIRDIAKVHPTRDYYFIVSGGKVFRFDKKGRFLNAVGKVGKGPKEYTYADFMAVSEPSQSVWLKKPGGLVVYGYDGSFKKNIILDSLRRCSSIEAFEDKILYAQHDVMGSTEASWYCLDQEGNLVGERLNYFKRKPVDYIINYYSEHCFYRYDKGLYCKELHSDTILKVGGGPAYVLDQKGRALNAALRVKDNGRFIAKNHKAYNKFGDLFETDSYLFLSLRSQAGYVIQVYNKKSGESRVFESKTGLENDLDGGLPVHFRSSAGDNNKLLGWVNAFELAERVNAEDFHSSDGDSKKKADLQALASGLHEDDNPVLVISTIK